MTEPHVTNGKSFFKGVTTVDFSPEQDMDPNLCGIIKQDEKQSSCFHAAYPFQSYLGEFKTKNSAIRAIKAEHEKGTDDGGTDAGAEELVAG